MAAKWRRRRIEGPVAIDDLAPEPDQTVEMAVIAWEVEEAGLAGAGIATLAAQFRDIRLISRERERQNFIKHFSLRQPESDEPQAFLSHQEADEAAATFRANTGLAAVTVELRPCPNSPALRDGSFRVVPEVAARAIKKQWERDARDDARRARRWLRHGEELRVELEFFDNIGHPTPREGGETTS